MNSIINTENKKRVVRKRKANEKNPYHIQGDILRDLRIEAGYSNAEDFAEEIGYGVQTYRAWEQGKKLPSEYALKDLSDFFGVSKYYLLGEMGPYRTIGEKEICELTGLSPKSVTNLIYCKKTGQSLSGKKVKVMYTDLFSSIELIDCLLSSNLLLDLQERFTAACRRYIDLKLAASRAELSGTDKIGYHPQRNTMDPIEWATVQATREYNVEIYYLRDVLNRIADEAIEKTITPEVIESLLGAINWES